MNELEIATAATRLTRRWKNRRWTWEDIVAKCSCVNRTTETVAEYMAMSRDQQSRIKDVGGFVGGYLKEGVRKTPNVQLRSLLTLDIDHGTPDTWEEFTLCYDCAALIYSTHKHTPEKPRYRLVIPLSRPVKPEEYEPIARRVADNVGLNQFDHTTYQLARLFYWPSASADGVFYFQQQKGNPLDPDAVLATYRNPLDASEWPFADSEADFLFKERGKAGEPTEKPGLIGAFCRAYSIEEAIDTFLRDIYEQTASEGRYTYRKGSVAGGLVCYEGKWAYSYHETDPASGKLCNAYDLVRIGLFSDADEGKRSLELSSLPSSGKMAELAAADKRVRRILAQERNAKAAADFADIGYISQAAAQTQEAEWEEELDTDKKGKVKSTAQNIITILEKSPDFAGKLKLNQFNGFNEVVGGLPWDAEAKTWTNRDDANLRVYMERKYSITGKDKIKDAAVAVFTRHRFHPIRQYLNALNWDGVPRLDTLFIDHLGARDSPLNRAMTRKQFTAAVARVFNPGCKFDYCLVLSGPEGVGKSTVLSIMGGEWFNDSSFTTEGKGGKEILRVSWIIEWGELQAIRYSDVEQVKAFLSCPVDIYRAAYASTVERFPRQCVIFATTNEELFLKGDGGNRRFWVIKIDPELRRRDDGFDALRAERDQLWAEAVYRFRQGEKLYLDRAMEKEARGRQQEFNSCEEDPIIAVLEQFLDTPLPVSWPTWDLNRRRAWFRNPDPLDEQGEIIRDRVCAAEFICERLGRDPGDREYLALAKKTNAYIRQQPGWTPVKTSSHAAALYGRQRAFERIAPKEAVEGVTEL